MALTRPMIGLDTETTGVDATKDSIVELALEIMVPGREVKEYRTLVNPGRLIPPEATAVHHITDDMVKDAPRFADLADNLLHGFQNCDFAGFSVRFDLMQLAEEFARLKKPWSYEGAAVIDGFRLWQIAEGRTLTHAVQRWLKPTASDIEIAEELDTEHNAHGALWDTRMSTRVIASQLHHCKELPRDPQLLHLLCWPDWFDPTGKLKWKDGKLCFTFGKHRNQSLQEVARANKSYLTRFVADGSFHDMVKKVCLDAANGIFQVQPQVGETCDS